MRFFTIPIHPMRSDAFFTEHLTIDNRKLFDSACERYAEVWTEQCKIFAYDDDGRKREIVEESDLSPQYSTNEVPLCSDNSDVPRPVEVHAPHTSHHDKSNNVLPPNSHHAGRRKYPRKPHHRSRRNRPKRNSRSSNPHDFNSQVNHTKEGGNTTSKNPNPSTSQCNMNPTRPNTYAGGGQNFLNPTNSAVQPSNAGNAPNVPVSTNPTYVPRIVNPNSAPFSSTLSGVNNVHLNNNPFSHSHQPNYFSNLNYLPRGMHHNIPRPRFPVFNPTHPPPGFAW